MSANTYTCSPIFPLALERLAPRFFDRNDMRRLLTLHVSGRRTSDDDAGESIRAMVATAPRRVTPSLPKTLDAMQETSVTGSCKWSLEARMHSTIPALLQSMLLAAIGYSGKNAIVFAAYNVKDDASDA